MSDPAGQENDEVTTTQVQDRPDLSEEDQKLAQVLNESALDGTRPTELVRIESRSGKGMLTIDPNQTDWTPAQRTALKSIGIETEGKDAVPIPHVLQFLHICQMRDLDPFLREAYLITHGKINVAQNGKVYDDRKFTLVVGIDGFRKRGEDSGEYAGQVGPEWCGEDGQWKPFWNPKWGPPVAARVGIMRRGHDVPTYGVAMYEEFVPMVPKWEGSGQNRRKVGMTPSEMWLKMGANQIAKCAEAQGFRKAFPRQMSGMYAAEEMERAQAEYQEQERQVHERVAQERRMAAYAASQGKGTPQDVVEGQIVDAPRSGSQGPISAADAVQETVAGMMGQQGSSSPQAAAQPSPSDAQRLAWLVEEVRFLEGILGHSIELLAKRQITALRKPIQQFTADELQLAVNPLRSAGIAKLRSIGREGEASVYATARPGVAAPLHVLIGHQPDDSSTAAVDPTRPHQFVDNGGICSVPGCERFEDDTVHARPS